MKLTRGRLSGVLTGEEEGQGLVEYALILFLVTLVVIVALTLVGPQLGSLYSSIVGGV